MALIVGRITILQEERFWLSDELGVAHHFTLAHNATLPSISLPDLQQQGSLVSVAYVKQEKSTTNTAHRIRIV